MFEKLKAKFAFKSDSDKCDKIDKNIKSLKVRMSFKRIYKELEDYLKENGFINIYTYSQYNELFGTKEEYEYTFSFIEDDKNGLTQVNVSIFNEYKRGASLKKLREFTPILREKFSNYLAD